MESKKLEKIVMLVFASIIFLGSLFCFKDKSVPGIVIGILNLFIVLSFIKTHYQTK